MMLRTFLPRSSNTRYFILGLFLTSIVGTAFQGTFHNFLNDIFHIDADRRGMLEFPRELPGFLVVVIVGGLLFLGEVRLLALSVLLTGLGLLGMANLSPGFHTMIVYMFIWSAGAHIHMSLREPVAMHLSRNTKKGSVLGKLNALRSAGVIAGTLLIWFFMGVLDASYARMYLGGFILCVLAAGLYSRIKFTDPRSEYRPRFTFIIRKQYTLFYLLAATFGVRKQLFLVFAPWLLIKFYGQEPEDLARLLLVSAVLGVLVKPYMGRMIDRFGERLVLVADAILIALLCAAYAVAPLVFQREVALLILYACYILDELLFMLRAARTTYLYRTMRRRSDLVPTLSMGLSIEHVVSMTTPVIAGVIWVTYGFYWVFVIAASIAVVSGVLSLGIPKE